MEKVEAQGEVLQPNKIITANFLDLLHEIDNFEQLKDDLNIDLFMEEFLDNEKLEQSLDHTQITPFEFRFYIFNNLSFINLQK